MITALIPPAVVRVVGFKDAEGKVPADYTQWDQGLDAYTIKVGRDIDEVSGVYVVIRNAKTESLFEVKVKTSTGPIVPVVPGISFASGECYLSITHDPEDIVDAGFIEYEIWYAGEKITIIKLVPAPRLVKFLSIDSWPAGSPTARTGISDILNDTKDGSNFTLVASEIFPVLLGATTPGVNLAVIQVQLAAVTTESITVKRYNTAQATDPLTTSLGRIGSTNNYQVLSGGLFNTGYPNLQNRNWFLVFYADDGIEEVEIGRLTIKLN